jgi:hypothetical protein
MSCSLRLPRFPLCALLSILLIAVLHPLSSAAVGAAAAETTAAGAEQVETPEPPEPPEEEGDEDSSIIRIRAEGLEDGDMVRVGQSHTIEADEYVPGDAVVIAGNLDLYGSVGGDAVVVGGTLHLYPGAAVEGDAVAVGGTVVRDKGATIGGEQVSIGAGVDKLLPWGWCRREGSVAKTLLRVLLETLGRMVLGFLAILIFVDLFGRRTARISRRLEEDSFRSGLVGLLGMVLIPVSILVLVISCLGILLLPVLAVVIAVAFAWGIVVSSLVTGRTVGSRLFPGERAARWQALLGLAILYVTNFVGLLILSFGGPVRFLGWTLLIAGKVVLVLALLVGFGAVLWTRFGRKGRGDEVLEESSPAPSAPGAAG